MPSTPHLSHEPEVDVLETRPNPKNDKVSTATPLLDMEKPGHIPKAWPTSPKGAKSSLSKAVLDSMLDIVLLACSVAFLIFAFIVNQYDQAPTADHPQTKKMLENATKYGPTVFPILFASVVGRAAHAILRWRLEKGERIGILDMLATSTSLTSTITSQFQLRMISVLGISLVVIWALSPIGGQASIRQMSIGTKLVTKPAFFRNMVHNGALVDFESDSDQLFAIVSTLFSSALLSPSHTRALPTDAWAYVKIPRIEPYEATSTTDGDGWYNTSLKNDDTAAYTSFVGIPYDFDGDKLNTENTDYNMRIQSPYLDLRCKPVNATANVTWVTPDTKLIVRPQDSVFHAGSGAVVWWSAYQANDRFRTPISDLKAFNFTYVPLYAGSFTIPCSMTTTYVETEFSCIANSTCRAIRVRRSQLEHLPPAWTVMDQHRQSWPLFLKGLMPDHEWRNNAPTFMDKYLEDPTLSHTAETVFQMRKSNPSDEEYSVRMGQLINAYLTCMNGIYSITGGINNATSYFSDTNITYIPPQLAFRDAENLEFYNITEEMYRDQDFVMSYNWTGENRKSRIWPSEGTKSIHTEVIMAHTIWVAVLAVISILLIITSLIPPFVRYFFGKSPDIAMNISSLAARNNPHIPIPATGTFLDASDRAKLLRDVRVRFGDVNNQAHVGSLAIGMFGHDGVDVALIRKGRLYE